MRLIDVQAFIEREYAIGKGGRVGCRTKVLQFRDDESTAYAVLSHRWIEQRGETTETNYDEMVELAKMEKDKQDEVRRRVDYQKILDCCKQAERDGYEWLWVDTCCIDKRSSAELSEAINSMYRWYENSRVCYAYLHDVRGPSFPTVRNEGRYPNSNGWPEWFSRGWTLQEMIAPSNVQFFNKDWQHIGDKKTLAHTLADITRVPHYVLTDGISSNRPCVAQIMSWAADRSTTRVEDKAYSLMGLLDVNMPMVYGEGKKAFHRLQLEIIRMSNDQSIFAWGFNEDNGRTGSILADDPSFFRGCHRMELMDPDEYIRFLKRDIPEEELPSIDEDQLGVFPITNRGIQTWLFLHPCADSDSVFAAWLPCRCGPSFPPVVINLALWKTNYYRYFTSLCGGFPIARTLQFRQLYLRYQDTPHRNAIFEIEDGAIIESGLTYCGTFPSKLSGNILTLTSTDPLCVKVYSDSRSSCRFAVGIGQCFGQDWIHFVSEVPTSGCPWERYAREAYKEMLVRGPEHGQSMIQIRSRGERYGHIWVKHASLLASAWTVQTSCVVWESSRNRGVKVEVFQYPSRHNEHEWIGFDVDVGSFHLVHHYFIFTDLQGTNDPNCNMLGLMIRDSLSKWRDRFPLLVDGVSMNFSPAPNGVKASIHTFHTLLESYENSWGTMVTSRIPRSSTAKETSLPTSGHLFQRQTSPQGNTKYIKSIKRAILVATI